jgi:Cu+-exporting ATPase
MVRDPVCDMDVEVEDAETRGLISEHGGRLFHFCSMGCKRLFDEDPMAYAAGIQQESDDAGGDFPSANE